MLPVIATGVLASVRHLKTGAAPSASAIRNAPDA